MQRRNRWSPQEAAALTVAVTEEPEAAEAPDKVSNKMWHTVPQLLKKKNSPCSEYNTDSLHVGNNVGKTK